MYLVLIDHTAHSICVVNALDVRLNFKKKEKNTYFESIASPKFDKNKIAKLRSYPGVYLFTDVGTVLPAKSDSDVVLLFTLVKQNINLYSSLELRIGSIHK